MKRWASLLLWSVIAAAFIGPGTVTTAASAGVAHGFALLWTLGFSTLATLALQEAAARLTIASGKTLGEALRSRYPRGLGGFVVLLLVLGAIVLGCAAYEAGNILGGVAGAALFSRLPPAAWTVVLGLMAGALLWTGSPQAVARVLSIAVGLMGVAFVWTAVRLRPAVGELLDGLLTPSLPDGSALLALGLVGTTVVPYNLFLGSGLARGERLEETRLGLTVSVGLGGLISMAIVVVGASIDAPFTFDRLASALSVRLGDSAPTMTGLGLLAAGLSSAVTAPLAAAMTAQSLFGRGRIEWEPRRWRFRSVWLAVLAAGLLFGLTGIRPIPAILAAQALNGVLLPVVACFVFVAVNDRRLMGDRINGRGGNMVLALTLGVVLVLGAAGLSRAVFAMLGRPGPEIGVQLTVGAVACAVATVVVRSALSRAHKGTAGTESIPREESGT